MIIYLLIVIVVLVVCILFLKGSNSKVIDKATEKFFRDLDPNMTTMNDYDKEKK